MEKQYKVPNYDVFGYCTNCGKQMIGHKIIDGVYKVKLSGEYTAVMFLLSDGSKMRVSMCQRCADTFPDNEDDRIHIMQKVYRGWQHEVETYSDWDEEKKTEYLDTYGKKRIVIRTDKLSSDIVNRVYEEYKKIPKKEKNILKEKKREK